MPEFKYAPPPIPFKLYDDPLKVLIEFYKEHIRRDIDGAKLSPAEFWVVLRGLLVSAAQTYTAVCLLLSEKQPKRLMLQAAILNRSLLETLGNVMALCQAPKSRTRILVREAYKNMALMFLRNQAKYGSNAKWREYLDVSAKGLDLFAKGLRISRRYIRNPNLISEQWPTPGRMIYGDKRRNQPPFLRGNRRKVFHLLYDSHYGHNRSKLTSEPLPSALHSLSMSQLSGTQASVKVTLSPTRFCI